MDVHNAALDDLPRGYLASPDAESQPPELLSLVFAVGGRGMDLLLDPRADSRIGCYRIVAIRNNPLAALPGVLLVARTQVRPGGPK
jgi:hypothetical protein